MVRRSQPPCLNSTSKWVRPKVRAGGYGLYFPYTETPREMLNAKWLKPCVPNCHLSSMQKTFLPQLTQYVSEALPPDKIARHAR